MDSPKGETKRGSWGCLFTVYAFALFFLLAAWFGPPLGTFGGWKGLGARLSSDLEHTTGTVIRLEGSRSGRSIFTIPIVEYSVNGKPMRFRGVGENNLGMDVGDRVPVAYRKSDLETAFIPTFGQFYGPPLLMLLFASPFVLISIAGTRNVLRARKPV